MNCVAILVLFISFFSYEQQAEANVLSLIEQHVDSHLDVFLNRQKRQKGDSSSPPAGGQRSIDESGAHCLVECLKPMINKVSMETGNDSLICPSYDPQRIGDMCKTYLTADKCLDNCPDSTLKNLSASGFRPLQFMCVDRNEDFKRHMPCVVEICDQIQTECAPVCGSMEESVQRLARVQQQISVPGSRSRGSDMDISEIMQMVVDNCRLIGCLSNCSRAPITQRCGADAYSLQSDTVWTMLSSMADSVASTGYKNVWPEECQTLLNADRTRNHPSLGPSSDATVHKQTSSNQTGAGVERPNSTDRFNGKQTVDSPTSPKAGAHMQPDNGSGSVLPFGLALTLSLLYLMKSIQEV